MNIDDFKSILPGKWMFDYVGDLKQREFNSNEEIVIQHPDGKTFTAKVFIRLDQEKLILSMPIILEHFCKIISFNQNQFVYEEISHAGMKTVVANRLQ